MSNGTRVIFSGQSELEKRLREASRWLGRSLSPIAGDAELFASLINLYAVSPAEIWTAHVAPFIEAHEPALRHVFAEHEVWPAARLLDRVEALLILERLENDRLRLARAWPLSSSELEELAAAWGTPLPETA